MPTFAAICINSNFYPRLIAKMQKIYLSKLQNVLSFVSMFFLNTLLHKPIRNFKKIGVCLPKPLKDMSEIVCS